MIRSFTYSPVELVSFELTQDGKIVVIKRDRSKEIYLNGEPVPDKVYKEIYGAKDGKIVLEETIQGKHITARVIAESFEFPK